MKQDLSHIELFQNLSDQEYAQLKGVVEERDFKKNETIFEKGECPEYLYVLKNGKIKLYDERKITQREEIIGVFVEGDSFDISALCLEEPYALSAKFLEPGTLFVFPQKIVRALFNESRVFLQNSLRILSKVNYQLIEGMSDLSLSTTKERLAKYLFREYQQQKGPSSFRLPLNQSQIASHLGTVREIVSRDLASLKKARVIDSRQGEIAVLNPDELSHIAEGYSFHS